LNSSSPSRAARDVDPIDLHHARELYLNSSRPVAILTNLLPAISAGNPPEQPSIEKRRCVSLRIAGLSGGDNSLLPQRVRDARLACGPAARALMTQKENQCPEN
jgi:hypothetical protein